MERCSVGVFNNNTGRIVSKSERMERGHSEALVPMIQAVLDEAGMEFFDLGAIAVPLGPGAFTGLRIGLSTAQSLGLSLNIPVIGLPSFDVHARPDSLPEGAELGILIETKRSDFYVYVAGDEPLALDFAGVMERYQGRNILWVGNAIERFQDCGPVPDSFSFAPGYDHIPLENLITAARGKTQGDLRPIYLRGADVSQSKTAIRTIV
jgi:tRNA threonylcarbamoyladenosine biosynthesis protein TsaB